jgi:hypothetical protein
MAVTTQLNPASYLPSYNNNWLIATSSQIAQPNFKYRVVLTDLISGFPITEDYTQNPAGELELDVSEFTQTNMLNFLPVNLYGWQKCAGASRKIRVNVGELYGAGTPVYYAGSNFDYIVWNGALELFDFANYSINAYIYESSALAYVFLSSLNEKTYPDRSNYLYALCLQGVTNDLNSILINTYNSDGTLLGSYNIDRPDYTTGLYTDQYQCIDVGYKGLIQISSLQVIVNSGSYPIIDNNVAYYDVINQQNGGLLKRITVECSQFDVYTLHYLNRKGGYDTLHCSMVTELSSNKTTTSFKKSPWSRSGYAKVLDPSGASEKTLSVNLQDGLRLNSDWLTQAEFDQHKDLFASPDIRLDTGKAFAYKSIKITNTSYTQRNRDRLRSLTFDAIFSHTNSRQKG